MRTRPHTILKMLKQTIAVSHRLESSDNHGSDLKLCCESMLRPGRQHEGEVMHSEEVREQCAHTQILKKKASESCDSMNSCTVRSVRSVSS